MANATVTRPDQKELVIRNYVPFDQAAKVARRLSATWSTAVIVRSSTSYFAIDKDHSIVGVGPELGELTQELEAVGWWVALYDEEIRNLGEARGK